jgi:hypothetical protein
VRSRKQRTDIGKKQDHTAVEPTACRGFRDCPVSQVILGKGIRNEAK